MHPRCWLPRRSWRLEHNQCHSLYYFQHSAVTLQNTPDSAEPPDLVKYLFRLPPQRVLLISSFVRVSTWTPRLRSLFGLQTASEAHFFAPGNGWATVFAPPHCLRSPTNQSVQTKLTALFSAS